LLRPLLSSRRPRRQRATFFPYTTLFRSNRSVFGFLTKSIISRRSRLNASTVFCHSASLEGPGVFGQYPSGNPGDSWFGLRLNSRDRKSTRLNSSHLGISYAVFCLKKKNI